MSDLFPFMAALAREQAENTAYETSQRRMLESMAKQRSKQISAAARSYQEVADEMRANFDSESASSINGSRA